MPIKLHLRKEMQARFGQRAIVYSLLLQDKKEGPELGVETHRANTGVGGRVGRGEGAGKHLMSRPEVDPFWGSWSGSVLRSPIQEKGAQHNHGYTTQSHPLTTDNWTRVYVCLEGAFGIGTQPLWSISH